jgi:hypothetical protein
MGQFHGKKTVTLWSDQPEGIEIMARLESILQRNPNHPGANHLYIHAVEKARPELGVAAADRLMSLVPCRASSSHGIAHLHSCRALSRCGGFQSTGYEADSAYTNHGHTQTMYSMAYMPHNHHFSGLLP